MNIARCTTVMIDMQESYSSITSSLSITISKIFFAEAIVLFSMDFYKCGHFHGAATVQYLGC